MKSGIEVSSCVLSIPYNPKTKRRLCVDHNVRVVYGIVGSTSLPPTKASNDRGSGIEELFVRENTYDLVQEEMLSSEFVQLCTAQLVQPSAKCSQCASL